MHSSYNESDVKVLLKDISGKISPLSAKEREKLIQSGVHYSELLPQEYEPSQKYINLYEYALKNFSSYTALAVQGAAEKIYKLHGKSTVIVSLARAGIPVGVLIKHYLVHKYKIDVPHYAISIIRGKGIDKNAMKYILERHKAENICFVDGWIGKGAIQNVLHNALDNDYPEIDSTVAVLSDPAHITTLCGTNEDFLIASSCLNCIVSGLLSRTVLRDDLIGKDDFHGAVFYREFLPRDRSYEFINAVEKCMKYDDIQPFEPVIDFGGVKETQKIAEEFSVSDINRIKPSIGEATRVLMRRVPDIILVRDKNDKFVSHLLELADEKGVEVREYPLKYYRACGIIKDLADT